MQHHTLARYTRKVILTHATSWPKSYNANSTLLTMIHLH